MGFHFLIIAVIIREFSVLVHQIVGDHVEFQLLVLGIKDQVVPLSRFGQRRARSINKGKYLCANGFHLVYQLYHFLGISGNGGIDHHRPVCQTFVAGGQIFCRIFHEYRQRRLPPQIYLCLHCGSISPADADVKDIVKALFPDGIYDLFDLGTQCQRAVDAIDISLLVQVPQAGAFRLCPGFGFIVHMDTSFLFCSRQKIGVVSGSSPQKNCRAYWIALSQ